jgi:hypothetical protein
MMRSNFALIGMVCVLCGTQQAQGQVIERPERAIPGLFGGGAPPDPSRPRHDLMLSIDTFGGYAEDLSQVGTTGFGPFSPRQPMYNAYAGSTLSYRRVLRDKFFEMGGGGYVNSYRNVGQPAGYGGEAHVRFRNPMGERHDLELGGRIQDDPFYELTTFGPLQGSSAAGILPAAGSPNGFSMRRSLYGASSASVNSRWSRRASTAAVVRYAKRDFIDNLGDGGLGSAGFTYTHIVGRRAAVTSSYRYTDFEFLTSDGDNPRTTHTVDLGYRYDHPFSPTRGFSIGFGGGATQVRTVNSVNQSPFQYVTPAGYANMRLVVARSWSIQADYRRDVSVLEGLTPEPFNTDAAMVHVGGLVHRRAELVVSGGYSNGRAGVAVDGHYLSYAGGSQLRLSVTRRWSAVVGHTYYAYQLRNVPELPQGLQTRMNRHTLRIGMALAVPLYGTYAEAGPQPGRD